MRELKLLLIAGLMALAPLVLAQTQPETGSITTATPGAGNCVSIRAQNNSAVGIIVTGTWSGTLQPSIYIYQGRSINKKVLQVDASSPQSTITANGGYGATVGGFGVFQICASAWTSGTAVIDIFSTPAPNTTIASAGGGTGSVTSVGSGTGLTGGPITSSGTLTVQFPLPAAYALTTLGDVFVGGAGGIPARVAIGTTGCFAYVSGGTFAWDSLWCDNGTAATYTGTGGIASPGFTANGTGAGNFAIGQGITVPGTTLLANSLNLSGQNAITTYQIVMAAASGGGIWFNTVATPATLTPTLVGNVVTSLTIGGGNGSPNAYALAPSVLVTGGSCTIEPTVTLSISAGAVNGYTLGPTGNPGGSGCTGTPVFTVVPSDTHSFLATLGVANGGTGITSFGSGVATWLGTPSTANLAAAVTASNAAGSLNVPSTTTYNGTSSGTAVPGCVPVSTCATGFGGTSVQSVWAKVTSGSSGGAAGFADETAGFTTTAMSAQTTATCTNITNMTWTISANKDYILGCRIPRTLATTATLQYCLGGPGTPTSYSLDIQGANGTAGAWSDINLLASTTYGTKTTASVAAADTAIDNIYAFIQNGSTGSGTALTLQTAANGTNSITVLANASCTLTQVN